MFCALCFELLKNNKRRVVINVNNTLGRGVIIRWWGRGGRVWVSGLGSLSRVRDYAQTYARTHARTYKRTHEDICMVIVDPVVGNIVETGSSYSCRDGQFYCPKTAGEGGPMHAPLPQVCDPWRARRRKNRRRHLGTGVPVRRRGADQQYVVA